MRFLIHESSWTSVSLSHALSRDGTLVTRCDAPETLRLFLHMGQHDLMVIDAADLGRDLALDALARTHPDLPICLLAAAPSPAQIARWLTAGAATVIDRACPLPEICARLGAVARRARGQCSPLAELGPLTIDLAQRRATLFGQPLTLAPKLLELLEFLVLRPNRIVSREALMSHLYGLENEPTDRIFSVYFCQLRAALAPARDSLRIETMRGEGYRLCCVQSAQAALAA